MHELSLVEELVEVCASRSGGRPVSLVRVRHASTIPQESLRQAFEMLTQGGPLAGAALQAEQFALELACACGFRGELGHEDLIGGSIAVCPSCGDVSRRPRTAELELLELR
ncbi:MAG TPA: hydrogenase maturation nickel metallochaperone HypA [Candidatus Limnocylindria bacterium]|nr:hydrogenase maturation nickel metallochaperone HypA [Candidatus Limnocylindria bacterium]